ncbi:MAG TPA: GNAT family N-acetyltransferase [Streptosporangiaceae bacterium]
MGYVVDDLIGYQATDLHPVVSAAFADYIIPLRTDVAGLDATLSRRGWAPAWSFGLFREERLVGFWLTGRDEGRDEAYCIMAGILPEARGSGSIDAMFAQVLAATGGRRHRLECIRGNERAARAYRRLGFQATRVLHYYQLPRAKAALGEPRWRAVVEPWMPGVLPPESWLNYPAAWQNRREAQRRAPQSPAWLVVREAGLLRGSAVLFPQNGDLTEIVVDPAARGRGIGRALLMAALQHSAPARVALTTVDARDQAFCSWLERCGAELVISQDEMVREASSC